MKDLNKMALNVTSNDTKLEQLLGASVTFIKKICRKYFQDRELVNDISQSCLIKVLYGFNTFKPEKGYYTSWLSRIVCNKCIEVLRSGKRTAGSKCNSISIEDASILLSDNTPDFSDQEEKEIIMKRLHDAVLSLEGIRGQIIRMRYIEEKSYREISAEIGYDINRVGIEIKRAIELLKKKIFK